jgi:hypothetical protein
VVTWNIRRKKTVSSLDTGSMQIGGNPLPHRIGRGRLLSKDECRNQFRLSRVLAKR